MHFSTHLRRNILQAAQGLNTTDCREGEGEDERECDFNFVSQHSIVKSRKICEQRLCMEIKRIFLLTVCTRIRIYIGKGEEMGMGHYVWKSSACMLLFNSNNSGDQKRYKDERVTDTNEKCRQVLTERGRYVSNVKKKNLRSIKEDIILARKSLYDKLCCISHSRL